MANGMSNPFAPMNQAWQGLNQAIVKAPQIRRQRRQQNLQNQLTKAKLYNEMQDVRQKRGLQNYMQQGREQAKEQEAQRISNLLPSTEQRQNLLQQAAVTPEAMGGGMQGLQQGQQFQNQMIGAAMQEAQTPPDFNPRRAQLEYLQQTDPQKAAEELQSELKSTLKLADYDTEAAEQRWESLTGHRLNIQQGEGGKYIESARGTMFVPEDEPTKAQLVRGPGGEPVQKGQEDMSAKEEEIQRYLDLGIVDSRQEATKLAEGSYEIVETPWGPEVWDMTTQTRVQGPQRDKAQQKTTDQQQDGQIKTPAYEPSFEITPEAGEKATGFWANLRQFTNNLSGLVGAELPFEETADARNTIQMFNQSIKKAVALNESRPSRYEQEMIQQFLPNTNALLKNPQESREQLFNLYDYINQRIQNKRQTIESERTSIGEEKELQKEVNLFRDLRDMFGEEFKQRRLQQKQEEDQTYSVGEIQGMDAQDLQNLNIDELDQRQTQAALNRLEALEQEQQ